MIAISGDEFSATLRETVKRRSPLASMQHAPRTIEAIRTLIARIPIEERCDPECPTWGIFDSDSRGVEVECCDECWHDRSPRLYDEDVARLPEAQAALAKELQAASDAWTSSPEYRSRHKPGCAALIHVDGDHCPHYACSSSPVGSWCSLCRDEDEDEDPPPCAVSMGCLCAFHARGGSSHEPCNATE